MAIIAHCIIISSRPSIIVCVCVIDYFFYFFTAVNITRPRFSGLDEFGYSSYMAYPSIPSMGHFYEFHLKLTFANNVSALRNSLILFSGQKGQGGSHWEYCSCLLLHLSLFALISVHPSALRIACCIYWCMRNKSWIHRSWGHVRGSEVWK